MGRFATALLLLAGSLAPLTSFAQQPPGYYAPSFASGSLTLNVASGIWLCSGSVVTYAGGSFPLSASTTYYFYLDPGISCAPNKNTTGFTTGQVPIAIVVTGSSAITTVTDVRTWFTAWPVYGVSSLPGATADVQISNCITALPSTGGVCDARGLTGAQTLASDMFANVNGRPGILLLNPSATFTVNATQNVPPAWKIEGGPGGYDADGSPHVYATLFQLGTVPNAFKFNNWYQGRFENVNVDCGGGTAYSISSISNPNGAAVTITTLLSNPYANGYQVVLTGITGQTTLNGTWTITVTSPTTFTLNSAVGNGVASSQGSANRTGTVGLWLDSNSSSLASSEDRLENLDIGNCQYGFQAGPSVIQANSTYQMDQFAFRRFKIHSAVPGAEAVTLNASNAAQAAVFEDGVIQAVNIGFDWKWYGGLAQAKRVVFGSLTNGEALSISGISNPSAGVVTITTANATPYLTGDRIQLAGISGQTALNATWYVARGVGITNASYPGTITITTAIPHGFSNGDSVQISGVLSNTAANGTWTIGSVTSTTFSLTGSSANASYTSGGTAYDSTLGDQKRFTLNAATGDGTASSGGTTTRMATAHSLRASNDFYIEDNQSESGPVEGPQTVTGATYPASPIVITANNHGYQTGDIVKITGLSGNTNANAQWQITLDGSDPANKFSLNGSTANSPYACSPGPCTAKRVDVNFINVNGSPNNGSPMTFLHNKFDEPVVINRGARITSIDNFGGAPAVCLAGSNCRVVSINDRFTNPGPIAGWDTSASGQVLRLGGGDRGTDYTTITSPSTITGAGVYSTSSMAAGIWPTSGSGPTETWSIDLSKGNTQQFTCGQSGAAVSASLTTSSFVKGEIVTLIFVQFPAGTGHTACTISWPAPPTHIYGQMTSAQVSTLGSVNAQQFTVSNNGTDLYAASAVQSNTGGTP